MTSLLEMKIRNATLATMNFAYFSDNMSTVHALLDAGHIVILDRESGYCNGIVGSAEQVNLAYDIATIYGTDQERNLALFPNGMGISGTNAVAMGRDAFNIVALTNLEDK